MQTITPVFKSTIYGFAFYKGYALNRSYAVGQKEQRPICLFDHMALLAGFAIAAQPNLIAVYGKKLASRVSKLEYFSHPLTIFPLIYFVYRFDTALNQGKNEKVRKRVDFVISHITDCILLANIVHTIAALRIGYHRIGNSIALTFYIWSFLEQGVFLTKPKENNGPLAWYNNGELLRLYAPLTAKLLFYINIPYNYLYGGKLGKTVALISGIALIPSRVKQKLIPEGVKRKYRNILKSWKEKISVKFGKQRHHHKPTDKIYTPFTFEDLFPKKSLKELELELQKKIEGEIGAKDKWEKLIGKKWEKGYLHQHVVDSQTIKEKEEKERDLKNIFGIIGANWNEYKKLLKERHDEFLCRPATGVALKKLTLELYSKGIKNKKEEYIESAIVQILQEWRDRSFIKLIQHFFQRFLDRIKKNSNGSKMGNFIEKFAKPQLEEWQQNLHSNNFWLVLLGKNAHITTYNEARRDLKNQLATMFIDISFIDQFAEIITPFFDLFFKALYEKGLPEEKCSWLDATIEAIAEENDIRLDFEEIRSYLMKKHPKDECLAKKAFSVATCVPPKLKEDSSNLSQVQEKWKERHDLRKAFLYQYLPLVLEDYAFISPQSEH